MVSTVNPRSIHAQSTAPSWLPRSHPPLDQVLSMVSKVDPHPIHGCPWCPRLVHTQSTVDPHQNPRLLHSVHGWSTLNPRLLHGVHGHVRLVVRGTRMYPWHPRSFHATSTVNPWYFHAIHTLSMVNPRYFHSTCRSPRTWNPRLVRRLIYKIEFLGLQPSNFQASFASFCRSPSSFPS